MILIGYRNILPSSICDLIHGRNVTVIVFKLNCEKLVSFQPGLKDVIFYIKTGKYKNLRFNSALA